MFQEADFDDHVDENINNQKEKPTQKEKPNRKEKTNQKEKTKKKEPLKKKISDKMKGLQTKQIKRKKTKDIVVSSDEEITNEDEEN